MEKDSLIGWLIGSFLGISLVLGFFGLVSFVPAEDNFIPKFFKFFSPLMIIFIVGFCASIYYYTRHREVSDV